LATRSGPRRPKPAPEKSDEGAKRAPSTRAPRAPAPKIVIGWNEYVDLPDWKIHGLRAKVDTGARSSALHVEDIVELSGGRVRFSVVLHRARRDRRVVVEAPIARRGGVRSSTGHYSHRIFVATRLRIGPLERTIEMSLVDRERMLFRMLLGRTALAGPCLVDVSHRAIASRRRRSVPVREGAKPAVRRRRRPQSEA
jgi:hypothetical protein